MTFLALIFLIAVALLAWTWAGVCIRKERDREAEAGFWREYALDELRAMRDEAA